MGWAHSCFVFTSARIICFVNCELVKKSMHFLTFLFWNFYVGFGISGKILKTEKWKIFFFPFSRILKKIAWEKVKSNFHKKIFFHKTINWLWQLRIQRKSRSLISMYVCIVAFLCLLIDIDKSSLKGRELISRDFCISSLALRSENSRQQRSSK